MAKENSVTPMMEQYFRIKKEHKDALLFFRLGDFYEMFYEDAKVGSSVLEIALTSRQKVPMCGVPYHSVNAHLAKLLKRGYKVAICEQVEDPKAAKGVVKREVIKVLTPGTAVEVELEEAKQNAYCACVYLGEDGWGLALVDLVTGEIKTTQGSWDERKRLSDELFKVSPKEIIYPEGDEERILKIVAKDNLASVMKSPLEPWAFEWNQASHLLLEHFKVKSLAGFGLDEKNRAVRSAGALLYYLKRVRKDALALVQKISYSHSSQNLILDSATIKNLELVKNLRDGRLKDSLLDVIDFTITSVGGRLLRSWVLQPSVDAEEINVRLRAVDELLGLTIERQGLRDSFKGIFDLERLTGKISLSAAHPRDFVSLKRSLLPLPMVHSILESFSSQRIRELRERWDNAQDIAELIERSILDEPAFLLTEGGIIKDGYNAELDELKAISRSGKTTIAQLEKKERERTGISSLKIRYNRVFGYSIEVTKANLSQVPLDYIRKQTLTGSERFLTPELKNYEEKVLHAEERIAELEYRLFQDVREKVARETSRLQKVAADLAMLDVLAALAELAAQRNYTRPEINSEDVIRIVEGRHPVVEATSGEPFIPNDTYLDNREDQVLVITGPNMGGKSTYLRQVALICILAQMGSFVPAGSATIGLVDRIFTRIGAMDFLSAGQSTFMVEMLETANILHSTTPRSLILLDEVGRGTSTFDGLSIAWAVVEYLHENESIRAKTLFATHYHELTELALTFKKIKNYHVSVREWKGDVVFLRKIISGPSDQSYGLHVAKLAGIPPAVIERAREILFNLEKQELDESGLPRIAQRTSPRRDKAQLLLFQADREQDILKELKDRIEDCDLSSLTPLEAMNFINELKEKLKGI